MSVEIIWLGHSAFQLKRESGEVILVDPFIEQNPKYPKGHRIERVDALLITHAHSDHIGDAVDVAKTFGPQVVGIYEVCQWLGSKGVENLSPMNKGGTQTVAGVRVTMTHAQHSSMIEDGLQFVYGGEAAGYVLRFPDGRSLYHAGDTNAFGDMQLIRELYQPELAMLPIGDVYTMDPREASIACRLLRPKKVIPMHYGTFPPLTGTPQQLKEQLKKQSLSDVEVVVLEPGKAYHW
jgi:L-ascorbate metabolism protein UlaG (beta-lactamase superfamily)